ncbi:hypothetical protein P7C73_g2323, partial [Tremellales sp. Uapishka_1]
MPVYTQKYRTRWAKEQVQFEDQEPDSETQDTIRKGLASVLLEYQSPKATNANITIPTEHVDTIYTAIQNAPDPSETNSQVWENHFTDVILAGRDTKTYESFYCIGWEKTRSAYAERMVKSATAAAGESSTAGAGESSTVGAGKSSTVGAGKSSKSAKKDKKDKKKK